MYVVWHERAGKYLKFRDGTRPPYSWTNRDDATEFTLELDAARHANSTTAHEDYPLTICKASGGRVITLPPSRKVF